MGIPNDLGSSWGLGEFLGTWVYVGTSMPTHKLVKCRRGDEKRFICQYIYFIYVSCLLLSFPPSSFVPPPLNLHNRLEDDCVVGEEEVSMDGLWASFCHRKQLELTKHTT